MTSKARALANLLSDGFVSTNEIADEAITSGKLASGAAASNLGSFVSSVNGQSGAVNISTTPTTNQVLAATAGASVGAVGTYAFLQNSTVETINEGTTRAGSTLNYANVNGNRLSSPAGTWRLMGVNGYSGGGGTNPNNSISVWLRIS